MIMFGLWNFRTPLSFVGSCIWKFCEAYEINLDRFAPIIFSWMMGVKGERKK